MGSAATTPPASREKMEEIQWLRGIAALGVLLWHASIFLGPYGEGVGATLFASAPAMGVDIFFAISGFIMVQSTRNYDGSSAYAGEFIIRRAARVWPAYFTISLLYWAAYSWQPERDLALFLKSMLFLPSGSTSGPMLGSPTLEVGWTLNYEMHFYLVFAASMLFGKARWAALVVWYATTLVIMPLMLGAFTLDPQRSLGLGHPYLEMIASPMNLFFVAGMICSIIYGSNFVIRDGCTARLVIIAATSFALWQYVSQWRIGHGVSNAGLSTIPLLLGLTLASKTIRLPNLPWLTALGERSYSIYILHPLVIWCYASLSEAVGIIDKSGGFAGIVAVLGLTLSLSLLTHRWLEVQASTRFAEVLRSLFRRTQTYG